MDVQLLSAVPLCFNINLFTLQARASFLDDFRSAISNINQGFGKLVGDVVTDVKDTLYCTISAVEQVLVQNGLLDKRTLYNQKCKGIEKPIQQTLTPRDATHIKTVRKHSVIHHKHSTRRISHESARSVQNVNETIINVLGDRMDLKNVSDTLANETNRLSEIRKLLRQESENISKNIKDGIKKFNIDNNKSTVESILEEIKFLNEFRRNSKNDTEVNELRRILDKVTDEMQSKTQNIFDAHNFKQLKKEIQQISGSDGKLQNPNDSKDVALNKNNKGDNENAPKTQKQDQQPQEKSLFNLGLESIASIFNSLSTSSDDLKNAANIVADSQHTDKVLSKLFKG
ncbi:uncharacterized protein LOC112050838 [Bicyclus anynana]|uniref:Uncharacterized protein LOC112050838 n=1 Tax=Bicyclus anynana TaxID=110368 RepID=A0ABM3LNZ9_BICAN|nr:uncharacterized protein LOC112050838 [Bicyclus anynana]